MNASCRVRDHGLNSEGLYVHRQMARADPVPPDRRLQLTRVSRIRFFPLIPMTWRCSGGNRTDPRGPPNPAVKRERMAKVVKAPAPGGSSTLPPPSRWGSSAAHGWRTWAVRRRRQLAGQASNNGGRDDQVEYCASSGFLDRPLKAVPGKADRRPPRRSRPRVLARHS